MSLEKISKNAASNKMEKTLLQAEKRFIDIELSVSDLKDAVSTLGAQSESFKEAPQTDPIIMEHLSEIPELKQKVEDVEDVVMVENMIISEMKDMVEDIKNSKPKETQAEVPEDLKERMDEIEENLAGLDGVEKMISDLMSNSKTLESDVNFLKESLSRGLMGNNDETQADMSSISRNMSVLDSRIDAMETVSKNISDEMVQMRSSFQKIGSLERISGMTKELRNKMGEFKVIESEVKSSSNRIEGFYQNLDKKFDKIRELDKMLPGIKEEVSKLREDNMKRMDENRVMILDRASKEETVSIRNRISNMEKNMKKMNPSDFDKKISDYDKKIGNFSKNLKNVESKVGKVKAASINDEFKNIDIRMEHLERRIAEADLGGIKSTIGSITSTLDQMQGRTGNIDTADVDNNFEKIGRKTTKVEDKFTGLEEKVGDTNPEDTDINFTNINTRLQKIEGKFDGLEKRMGDIGLEDADGSFMNINKRLQKMEDSIARISLGDIYGNFNSLDEKLLRLEDRISDLSSMNVSKRFEVLKSEIKEIRYSVDSSRDSMRKEENEDLKRLETELMNKLSDSREPISVLNIGMSDIMSRIISMEARMGGVENVMENMDRVKPIIIE